MIEQYQAEAIAGNHLTRKRQTQNLAWMKRLIDVEIQERLMNGEQMKRIYPKLESSVVEGKITPMKAAGEVIKLLFEP